MKFESKVLLAVTPLMLRRWLFTGSILTLSVCGCILGLRLQIPSIVYALLTSISYSPPQFNLAFIQVMMEKQLAIVSMLKLDHSILHLEPRDVKAVTWHGFNIFILGICEVSVIVPTLNEERYIRKCLSSLREQNFDGRFEIIVVDGGSRDSTVDLAGSMADKVIIYEGRPVGDARNFGAKLAESSIVAFIDADTVASRDWLSSIEESLSCKDAVGVTGPTLPYQGSGLDVLAYRVATGWLQRFSMIFGLPHVAGFNCAYRREPFMRCGGFEEGRTLSEDLALSLKIRHEGRLLFNKRMVAYTSTRRVRRYGYVRLAMFYLLNDAIFA
ncbi:MAG: glycosyltransferase, partial [Candidatus Bathyarchaeia archaeon]